jgi:hypothetical protein
MYVEGTTGTLTSVNSPGTTTKITMEGFRTGLIAIRNLGGVNTLQYTITGYANRNPATAGIADVTIADIAPNATVTFNIGSISRAFFNVVVTPKVAASQSTYVIEWCQGL